MEGLVESISAIGVGTAGFAISHSDLSRSSLGSVHDRLNAGRFGSLSLTKCIVETHRVVRNILDSQHAGLREIEEMYVSSNDDISCPLFVNCSGVDHLNFRSLNIEDLNAGYLLQDELLKAGKTQDIPFSPVVVDWIKETSERIMSTVMPARNLESLKKDEASDLWLIVSAFMALRPLMAKWATASQGQAEVSVSMMKGSPRLIELIGDVSGAFLEQFMQQIIDVLLPQEQAKWLLKIRELVKKIQSINVNRVKTMKSWFMDHAQVKEQIKGYEQQVRELILFGLGSVQNMANSSINAAEHRLNRERLAELLQPFVSKHAEQDVEPWELELPFGDVVWSQTLPNGERLHFMANGYRNLSTITIRQPDISPYITSVMSYGSEQSRFEVSHAISATIRFGDQVCPGDMHSSKVPLSAEDPAQKTILEADRVMRKKVNEIWCAHPQLIGLALTAAPLWIAEDGGYTYISCRKSGRRILLDTLGEDANELDVTGMAEHFGMHVNMLTIGDLVAFRIPTRMLKMTDEQECLASTVNQDPASTSTDVCLPRSVRSILQSYLNGSGVKSYHDYINALRKLGVKERTGNGSHIVLTTEEGGFTVHSYAFRCQGSSPIKLQYVSRDLIQLGIKPEEFLNALTS